MTALHRDEQAMAFILGCRASGWTLEQIGKAIGRQTQAVSKAIITHRNILASADVLCAAAPGKLSLGRGKAIVWTAEVDAWIVCRRRDGAILKDIARELGISASQVLVRARMLGATAPERPRREIVWTDDAIRLRDLWAEGHSASAIGRILGMSKCAVIGRAHRLGLPARQSPIRQMSDTVDVNQAQDYVVDRPPLPPGHPESWGAICSGLSSFGAYDGRRDIEI